MDEPTVLADGGTDRYWRAGTDPPSPPTDSAALLETTDADVDRNRAYSIRVALTAASEEYALRVHEQLRNELTVHASSYTEPFGPENPAEFDVLVTMDYDPATVADALANPGAVEAVAICPVDANQSGATTDDASVREAVADVQTSTDEDGDTTSGDADDPDPDSAQADGFDELKRDVERAEYDEVVTDLEETTLPGDFDDDADLDPYLHEDAEADSGGESSAASEPSTMSLQDPEPAAGNHVKATSSDGGMHADAPSTRETQVSPEDVVDALVTALENDVVSDEQRERLADELETSPPNRVMVRLEHLQREVDELTAYKDSMESFIDEYGSGDALLEQFDTLNDSVGRLDASVRELQSTQDQLQGRVDDVETRVDDLEALETTVSEMQSEIDARLDELRESLEADVETRLDDVDEDVAQLDERLSAVEAETVASVEELVEEMDAISTQLDALVEWRNGLRSAVGAVTDGQPDQA